MFPYSFAKKLHMHLEHMRTLASAAVSENDVNNTKTASGPSAFHVAARLQVKLQKRIYSGESQSQTA